MAGEDYLDEVRAQGTYESSGVFSHDLAAMLAKLGKHQLPAPELFVLKLVQSAVAGGASEIRFRTDLGHDLEVTFDGRPWEAEELGQLSHFLAGAPPDQRHLHHLAVGLQAALARSPWSWELLSRHACLTQRGLVSGSHHALNTLRLDWRTRLQKVLNWLTMQVFWKGGQLLASRAMYAPIAVFLNKYGLNRHAGAINIPFRSTGAGSPLVLEPDVDAHGICYFLPVDRPGDVFGSAMSLCHGVSWWTGHLLQPSSWQSLPTTPRAGSRKLPGVEVHSPLQQLPSIHYGYQPALGCAALLQSCPMTASLGSVLTLICDGVALDGERLRNFPPGYKMWVSAQGLATDLSQFKVVKDERYNELVQSLNLLIGKVWQGR